MISASYILNCLIIAFYCFLWYYAWLVQATEIVQTVSIKFEYHQNFSSDPEGQNFGMSPKTPQDQWLRFQSEEAGEQCSNMCSTDRVLILGQERSSTTSNPYPRTTSISRMTHESPPPHLKYVLLEACGGGGSDWRYRWPLLSGARFGFGLHKNSTACIIYEHSRNTIRIWIIRIPAPQLSLWGLQHDLLKI